jgi:AraC family transcriptional regulator of adaptative response/methylated-DNA-[protein]-cysteine methyltransferase
MTDRATTAVPPAPIHTPPAGTGASRRGTSDTLRVAVGESSLGLVLVAHGERGVRAVLIGDDPDALRRDLQARFPRATLAPADAELDALAGRVIGVVESPARTHAVPLDVRGTAFQQAVWRALREIPPGSTATYAEIAGRVGAPTAVRAVAQACAANPLAVVVPCHRVVRRDGGLSGYRWGVQRKRALLDREGAR